MQGLQGVFIALDSGFELANVLSATFTKRSLGLPIALLTLFGGGIDLGSWVNKPKDKKPKE